MPVPNVYIKFWFVSLFFLWSPNAISFEIMNTISTWKLKLLSTSGKKQMPELYFSFDCKILDKIQYWLYCLFSQIACTLKTLIHLFKYEKLIYNFFNVLNSVISKSIIMVMGFVVLSMQITFNTNMNVDILFCLEVDKILVSSNNLMNCRNSVM